MYSNFLQSCILEPTRTVANNRPSITDNIFINNIDKKTDKKIYQKIKIRDMKNFNRAKYLKELEEINAMLLL